MAPDEYQLNSLKYELTALRGEVERLRKRSSYIMASVVVQDTSAATAANYGSFFVAPFACEVIEAWESHKTAGSSTPTLTIEKLVGGQALDAGTQVLSSTWSLAATANEPRRVRATSVFGNRFLNPGDRLALKDSGTLTAVAHVCVTVLVKVQNTTISQSDNP